jgi:hypothetical protein
VNNLETFQRTSIEDLSGKVTQADATTGPLSHSTIGECETIKQNGIRCQARALAGKSYCFFHDPASAAERSAASSRGGAKKHCPAPNQDTIEIPLNNRSDAASLLAKIINQLVHGAIDPKIANGAGFLIGIWLKATETHSLEERLAALEVIVEQNATRVL